MARAYKTTETRRASQRAAAIRADVRAGRKVSAERRAWFSTYEKRHDAKKPPARAVGREAPPRRLGRGTDALFKPAERAELGPRAPALLAIANEPFELNAQAPAQSLPTEQAAPGPTHPTPPAPSAPSPAGKCPRCAQPIADAARHCGACGAPVRIDHCPKCERKLDGAKFCVACGTSRLVVAPPTKTQAEAAGPSPPAASATTGSASWTVGNCEMIVKAADLILKKLKEEPLDDAERKDLAEALCPVLNKHLLLGGRWAEEIRLGLVVAGITIPRLWIRMVVLPERAARRAREERTLAGARQNGASPQNGARAGTIALPKDVVVQFKPPAQSRGLEELVKRDDAPDRQSDPAPPAGGEAAPEGSPAEAL